MNALPATRPAPSIRTYFFAAVLVAVLPLAALLVATAINNLEHRSDQVREINVERAGAVVRAIDVLIASDRDVLARLAALPGMQADTPATCDPVLRQLDVLGPHYANIAVVNREGKVVCSAEPVPTGSHINISHLPHAHRVVETGKFTISAPFVGPITGKLVVALAYPRKDADARVVGWVGSPLDLTEFKSVLAKLRNGADVAYLISRDGHLISSAGDQMAGMGSNVRDTLLGQAVLQENLRQFRAPALDGTDSLFAAVPVPDTPWIAVTGTSYEIAIAPFKRTAWLSATGGLLTLTLALGLVVLAGRKISKPMVQLRVIADSITKGETGLRTLVEGPRELRQVAQAFNAMLNVREQTETVLRTRENQLSLIYDNVHEIIFVIGVEPGDHFRFLSVNRRFTEATGIPEDRIVGKLVQEVIPKSALNVVFGKYKEAIRSGQPARWEETSAYPKGNKTGEVTVAPVLDAYGKCTQLIGTVHDITERKQSEQALQESHKRLLKAQQVAHMGFLDWNLKTDEVLLSDEVRHLYGFKESEIRTTPEMLAQRMHPDDLENVRKNLDIAVRGVQPYNIEHRIVRADGSIIWVHSQAELVFDANGVPQSLLGTSVDITARKRSEAMLFAQKRILEMIASGTPLTQTLDAMVRTIEELVPDMLGSILLMDEDGVHVRHGAAPNLPENFSRAFDGEPIGPRAGSCGTAAYRREQVIVEDIATDPLWDNYRDLALRHGLRACWSTPIFDKKQRVLGTFALYFRTPRRPAEEHLQIIAMVTGLAAIAISKARDEEVLKKSEERLRLALDAAELGTFDWNLLSNQISWSPQHEILWGMAPGEFDGTYEAFSERVHPDDLPGITAEVARCIDARAPFVRVFRVVWPDGSLYWILGHGKFIYDKDGAAVRMLGISQDITKRIASEEALRNYAGRLRDMSRRLMDTEESERRKINRELHDRVGQNLAALNLMLSILVRELPSETAASVTASLDESRKLIETTTADVRNLMADLRPPALDDYGLHAALSLYAGIFSERSEIKVTVSGKNYAPRLSPEEEIAFFRIAQEALNNVAKHAQTKSARILLSTSGNRIKLAIDDQGAGFDPARASKQASWGLTTMRERAEAVGASLQVDTSPGKGTRITIELQRETA